MSRVVTLKQVEKFIMVLKQLCHICLINQPNLYTCLVNFDIVHVIAFIKCKIKTYKSLFN